MRVDDAAVKTAIEAGAQAAFEVLQRPALDLDILFCRKVAQAAIEAYKEALYRAYCKAMDADNEKRANEIVHHAFAPDGE